MTQVRPILSIGMVLLLLTFGAIAVSVQVPGPQTAVAARFGQRRIGLPPQSRRNSAEQSAATQPDTTFGFGLIDFRRYPDSTAFGVNSKNEIVGIYGANLPQWEGTTQSLSPAGNTKCSMSDSAIAIECSCGA